MDAKIEATTSKMEEKTDGVPHISASSDCQQVEKTTDLNNDSLYAQIFSFFNKFYMLLELEPLSFEKLEALLTASIDGKDLDELINLQQFLLRKTLNQHAKKVTYLVKFCSLFPETLSQELSELERVGYKDLPLKYRLTILAQLCDCQFRYNPTFKLNLENTFARNELRLNPIGKSRDGNMYFYQQDHQLQIRVWCAPPSGNEPEWALVVKSPDELLSLIYALLCSEDRKPIELSSELRSKISMQASEWSYWDVFQPETVLNKKLKNVGKSKPHDGKGASAEKENIINGEKTPETKAIKGYCPKTVLDSSTSASTQESDLYNSSSDALPTSDDEDDFDPSSSQASMKTPKMPAKKKRKGRYTHKKRKTMKKHNSKEDSPSTKKIIPEVELESIDEESGEGEEEEDKEVSSQKGGGRKEVITTDRKMRYKKWTKSKEDTTSSACRICSSSKQPDVLLLCDHCDDGYHTFCLNPPLEFVPPDDWFCPNCEHSDLVNRLSLAYLTLVEKQKSKLDKEEALAKANAKRKRLEDKQTAAAAKNAKYSEMMAKKRRLDEISRTSRPGLRPLSSAKFYATSSTCSTFTSNMFPAPTTINLSNGKRPIIIGKSADRPQQEIGHKFSYQQLLNERRQSEEASRKRISSPPFKPSSPGIFSQIRDALKISPCKMEE